MNPTVTVTVGTTTVTIGGQDPENAFTGLFLTDEEIRGAFEDVEKCPECDSQVGLNIYADGDWNAVVVHVGFCPAVARREQKRVILRGAPVVGEGR